MTRTDRSNRRKSRTKYNDNSSSKPIGVDTNLADDLKQTNLLYSNSNRSNSNLTEERLKSFNPKQIVKFMMNAKGRNIKDYLKRQTVEYQLPKQ